MNDFVYWTTLNFLYKSLFFNGKVRPKIKVSFDFSKTYTVSWTTLVFFFGGGEELVLKSRSLHEYIRLIYIEHFSIIIDLILKKIWALFLLIRSLFWFNHFFNLLELVRLVTESCEELFKFWTSRFIFINFIAFDACSHLYVIQKRQLSFWANFLSYRKMFVR